MPLDGHLWSKQKKWENFCFFPFFLDLLKKGKEKSSRNDFLKKIPSQFPTEIFSTDGVQCYKWEIDQMTWITDQREEQQCANVEWTSRRVQFSWNQYRIRFDSRMCFYRSMLIFTIFYYFRCLNIHSDLLYLFMFHI